MRTTVLCQSNTVHRTTRESLMKDKADPTLLPEGLRSGLLNDLPIVFKADTTPADIRLIADKWKALPGLLDAAGPTLESMHSAAEIALMRRTVDGALVSLEGLARIREAAGEFRAADNNLRDQWMGE